MDVQSLTLPHQRTIKSYVRRAGRITSAQAKALAAFRDQFVIAYQPQVLDFVKLFSRDAPTILEIGFGMGEATATIACAQPQHNFLCCEVFETGIGSLLHKMTQGREGQTLCNIRIIAHDAVEVLQTMIARETLAGVHIYFPDPWPKKRHHKRRLIQAAFIQLLTQRMQKGSYLHCATDWQHYAEQMLQVLSEEPSLRNRFNGFAEGPQWRPLTKFEARAQKVENPVWDLLFEKAI